MGATGTDLTLKISGDSAEGRKAVQELADALSGLSKSAQDSSDKASGLSKFIDDLTPSTKNAGAAFKDLKSTLEDVWQHPTKAVGDLAKALSDDLGGALSGTTIAVGAAVVGIGLFTAALAFAAKTAFDLAEKAAGVGSAIERSAIIAGTGAEEFSSLKFATEATGGSVETLTNAAFMLERRLGDAGATGTKTRDALAQLGIAADDFVRLPVDQQVLAISNGFRGLPEGVNKAAIAFDLLGRQGRDMLPTLMQPMESLVEEGKRLGLTWSETDVKAAHEFEVQVNILRAEINQLSIDLGKTLIPLFNMVLPAAKGTLGWFLTDSAPMQGLRDLQTVITLLNAEIGGVKIGAALGFLPPTLDFGPTPTRPGVPSIFSPSTQELDAARSLHDVSRLIVRDILDGEDAHLKAVAANAAYQKSVDAIRDALLGETGRQYETIDAIRQVIDSGDDNLDVLARTVDAIDKLSPYLKEQNSDLLDWAYANRTIKGAQADLTGGMAQFVDLMPGLEGHAVSLSEDIDNLDSSMNEFHGGISIAGDTLSTVTIPMFSKLATGVVPQATRAIHDATQSFHDLSAEVRKGLEGLPDIFQKAFEGGGGIAGALKSAGVSLGHIFAQSLKDSIQHEIDAGGPTGSTGLTGTDFVNAGAGGALIGAGAAAGGGSVGSQVGQVAMGSAAGAAGAVAMGATIASAAALGAATMGIGLAVVGLIALIRSMGPSVEELSGRDAEAKFQKSLGGFDQMMAKVGAAYAATGRGAVQAQSDVKMLLDSEKAGPEATQQWIDKINAVFKEEADNINAVLTAGKNLGEYMPQSLREQIALMENNVGVTDDQKTALQALLDSSTPTFDQLVAVGQKYGLTLEDMGKKFEQGGIEKQAKGLYNDFTELVEGGANVGAVLNHMQKPVQDLITASAQWGTAIPDNLRPMIEKMIEAGLLTDDTGQKITDVSKIKFEETPLDKGLKTLTDAVDKLVKLFTHDLPNSIADLANTPINVPVNLYRVGDENAATYAARGGWVTRTGVEYFGSGGWVPRGTDVVPAMLSPDEAVLNRLAAAHVGRDAIRALNAGMRIPDLAFANSTGGFGGITVNVTVEGSVQRERDLALTIAQVLNDEARARGPIGRY